MQKATAIVFLLIGVVLLIFARKIADSFGSQVQQAFTGAPTDRAVYLYIGGIVLVILGIAQMFWRVKKK
jgi:hypothetical protein